MATVIKDKTLDSWEEAVEMVRAETNMPELLPDISSCFDFVKETYDKSELETITANFLKKELRKKFGDCSCESSLWYVPVPRTKYVKAGLPHIAVSIDLYVAASAEVDWYDNYNFWHHRDDPCIVVGKLRNEVAKFNAPLVLLKALAEDSESQFEIIEKDHHWSTWQVHSFEARIPNSLVLMLKEMKDKPFGTTLEEGGLIGKGIGPLLEEGLAFAPAKEITSQLPGPHASDYDSLVACLKEQMGYPITKAEEAAKYVTEKYASEILEDKIKYALGYLSG